MSDLSFSERMRQLRQARGISLRGLARCTFYGKTYLHELETGVKPPTKAVAQRVDDALGAEGELVALTAAGPSIGRRGFVIGPALLLPFPIPCLYTAGESAPPRPGRSPNGPLGSDAWTTTSVVPTPTTCTPPKFIPPPN